MKMKGNLISLSSVILILLVGMAMTGCVTTSLHTAAFGGDAKTVIELLDKGGDINAKQMGFASTPLHVAAGNGRIDIVRLLLDRGAAIDMKIAGGWTPLMDAARKGHVKVAELLIDRGADTDYAIAEFVNISNQYIGGTRAEAQTALKIIEKIVGNRRAASKPVTPSLTKDVLSIPAIKSDVDELPATKAKPNKNAYAIVIGIEQYRQKLPKADFAVADAKIMTEYLTKVMGYPEENVVTLLNEHATNVDLAKYFEKWLPNNVEKDGTVFIYYSGHGAPNIKTGDAYLVPYDGDPSFIEQTGYPLKKLYESLNKLPAKEIIVALDSCFSGAGGKSVIAKGARPLVMNLEQDIKLSKNMIVMSASAGDQISSTYLEKGHGLFTYFMLKGIKDGITEIGELFDYLKPHVGRTARKVYNNEQTPQLIAPEKKKVFLRD